MNKQVFIFVFAALIIALAAAGCGGSSDDETSSLTKAQFIKQGDAVCKEVEEKRGKAIGDFYDKEEARSAQELGAKGQEKLVLEVALPPVKGLEGELEALGAPEGDESEIEAMFKALDQAIAEVEKNPNSVLASAESPFDKPGELATKYGFETCLQY
ncbi:MAG TPA: hypothetical protein VFU11_02060 [Solirubrobacterales bacterium]|nr:hypothetical protein [Solirubrobacterales bacterium]